MYIIALVYIEQIRSLVFFGVHFVYTNINDAKLYEILDNRATSFIADTVKLLALIATSAFCFCALPLYEFIFNGQRALLINLMLPFVDPDTWHGFYLNTLNIAFTVGITVAGQIAFEITHLTIINNLKSGADVVRYNLSKLDVALNRSTSFSITTKCQFRNIIMRSQDLNECVHPHFGHRIKLLIEILLIFV